MNLVDQYIDAVMIHLPQTDRIQAEKQLRNRIEMMLPENATDNDICSVLEELGNPALLADDYRQRKRYLIGPHFYYSYLYVLKIVMLIVVIVFPMISLLQGIVEAPVQKGIFDFLVGILGGMLSAAFQGAAEGFLFVTLAFIIMEKAGVNADDLPFHKRKWSIEDLTKPVYKKRKIARPEIVFVLFFSVFVTALIFLKPQWIGIYTVKEGKMVLSESLFVLERLHDYLPFILLLAFLQLCICIFKFIQRQWSIPIAIVNTLFNLFVGILFVAMAVDGALINQGFISEFIASTHTSFAIWLDLKMTAACLAVLSCAADSISGFVKCRVGHSPASAGTTLSK